MPVDGKGYWISTIWHQFASIQLHSYMLVFSNIPAFPSPSFFVWSLSVQPEFLLLSIGLSSAHPVAHLLCFFWEDLSIFQWYELDDAEKNSMPLLTMLDHSWSPLISFKISEFHRTSYHCASVLKSRNPWKLTSFKNRQLKNWRQPFTTTVRQ